MSIARTAPGKYELQDLVCIELVLRFGKEAVGRFVVEPKGGEDGALFTAGATPQHYEIQGKGAAGQVSLAELALWLTHFPEHGDSNMLLERLLADPVRHLVIVASGRVADALDPLVAPANWRGQPLSAPPATLAQLLLATFRASPIEGQAAKDLGVRRSAHHARIAAALKKAQLAKILRRIVIIERATTTTVTSWIGDHLKRLGVPDDSLDDAINRLKANVGLRRNGTDDLAATLFAQIERDTPASVRPAYYVSRGDEADWVNLLRTGYALLLSGVTRSGKSFAARWVAAEFEASGFRIEEFTTLEAAERYLLDPAGGGRIAIVDDPLGGAHPVSDPDRQLQRLSALLPRVKPARRLIVAQGRERLLETAAASDLAALTHHGHRWADLGRRSPGFLADLWAELADLHGVAEPLRSAMEDAVRAEAVWLEPGSLDYLANLPEAATGTMTVDAAARAASIDAVSLSHALNLEAKSRDLLPALAIASEPQAPAPWSEIAFVCGEGGDTKPSRADKLGMMIVIGGPSRSATPLPDYDAVPVLDLAATDDLDRLERRHILTTDAAGRSGFTHPFYHAAAAACFRNPGPAAAAAMLSMHERALFARDVNTARAAARSLDRLLENAGSRSGVADALFRRAEDGLESLYPAVRDLCFAFLMRHTAQADPVLDGGLARAVHAVSSVELESLEWINGEAMFPVSGEIRDDALVRGIIGPKHAAVAAILGPLAVAGGSALTPEAAAEAMLYFKRNGEDMARGHIANLLAYDEAVIRAEAVKAWLRRPRDDDEDILARIFADTHPLVARRALGAGIAGYQASSTYRQKIILSGLSGMAVSPANAALFLDRLVLFDRDHVIEGEKPWIVFATLMPLVFDALPVGASFIEARLHNAMLEAGPILSPEDLARICDRWVAWIERMDRAGHWLDDFALGVTDILFRFLGDRPDLRADIVARLVSLRLTTSLLTILKDAVDHWPSLSSGEQAAVISALTADAIDTRWRKAVALTRTEVPEAVQAALIAPDVRLADDIDAVRTAIGSDLFAACVAVQAGYPSLLSEWRALEPAPLWKAALEQVVADPNDPLFAAAFSRAMSMSSFGGQDVMPSLIAAAHINADAVFEHLVEHSIYDGGRQHATHWQVLLEVGPASGDRSAWFDRLADVSPEVVDNFTRLDVWITDAEYRAEIEARLATDETVLRSLLMMADLLETTRRIGAQDRDDPSFAEDYPGFTEPAEIGETFGKVIAALVTQSPPRFLATLDVATRILGEEELLTAEVKAALEATREVLLASISAARKSYSAADRARAPTDWLTAQPSA